MGPALDQVVREGLLNPPHGDRHLNCALHIIAIQRQRHDPATKTYIERRRAEGKTDREIRRCLKRYIARELYRTLESGLDSQ